MTLQEAFVAGLGRSEITRVAVNLTKPLSKQTILVRERRSIRSGNRGEEEIWRAEIDGLIITEGQKWRAEKEGFERQQEIANILFHNKKKIFSSFDPSTINLL